MFKTNIDALIETGNSFFKASNNNKAIQAYTEAIEKSEYKNSRAYSNRSAVYLKQNKYSLAYDDALKAIELGEHLNEKTLFRAGKSAYAMRQFRTSLTHFDACSKLNPQNNVEAMRELKKTNQRLLESSTGKFDLDKLTREMFKRVEKREALNFDCADFKSSQITIVNIENKSKGVIANKFIKKGTLLCASKALSAVFKYTNDGALEDTDMFADLMAKMSYDPYLRQQVYTLCPGAGFSREIDETLALDQAQRLKGICKTNSFKVNLSQFKFNRIAQYVFSRGPGMENQVTGLWHLPSFFNHSCVPNASSDFLGDMLFVFAKQDIHKNEEININYFDYNKILSYEDRCECIEEYGFKCDCRLCELDSRDKQLQRRENMILRLAFKNLNFKALSLKEALDDVKLMEDTYLKRDELQHGLVNALQNLACRYKCETKWKMSAQTFERIFMVGKETCEKAFLICMLYQAYNDYVQCFERKMALACKKRARAFYDESQKNYFETIWAEFANGCCYE